MPLYEYRCQACGDVFEVLQKFSDEPLETHAACGGKVERLLSPAALHFKGSGWYVTDYAHKHGTNGSSNGKSTSETKPATSTKPDTSAKPDTSGTATTK